MAAKPLTTRTRASEDAEFAELLRTLTPAQLAAALPKIRALVASQVTK